MVMVTCHIVSYNNYTGLNLGLNILFKDLGKLDIKEIGRKLFQPCLLTKAIN